MPRNKKDRKAHLKKRMKQRYNIDFTKEHRNAIKDCIKNGDAVFVSQRTEDSKVYDVPYENCIVIRVVYNHRLEQIVTALPGSDSVRFRVEYRDESDKRVFTEIQADGKIHAATMVKCFYNAREVKSVTPL
jgi:hypothetical protein